MKTDTQTTVEEIKRAIDDFCEARDWKQFHNAKDLLLVLGVEVGELQDPFRFKTEELIEEQMKDPSFREEIGSEIADVFYWILRFSDVYGFDLTKELKKKLAHCEEKYPVEKCKGKPHKYTYYQ